MMPPKPANRGTRATRAFGRMGMGTILFGMVGALIASAWAVIRQVLPSSETIAAIIERVWTSRSTRRFAGLIGACAAISLCCWLMQNNLRSHARHQIDPGRVEISAAPAWAKSELGKRIKREIEEDLRDHLAALPPSDAFDSETLAAVHAGLSKSPWVRNVVSVQRHFSTCEDGQAELVPVIEFRTPAICVATQDAWILVDADGVRLPLSVKTGGEGSQAEFEAMLAGMVRPVRVVEGVASKAPTPGKKWESEEIAAAISMERVLRESSMDAVLPINRMKLVGVPEHADAKGRVRYAPGGGVVLMLDEQVMPQTILLWGRPPAHAGTLEISVNDKINELRRLLKEPEKMQGKAIDLTVRKAS